MGPEAWVLNFAVDREFAAPGYVASQAVRKRMSTLARELGDLLDEDARLVDETTPVDSARGHVGFAWSPTPRAHHALVRAGAIPPPAPSLDVLMRVNSRRFSAELGQTLPLALFVDTEAALRRAVARPIEGSWCIKEAFGASGSGRRLVQAGALTDEDTRWARRALAHGVQIEPWVSRLADFALHGYLSRVGSLTLGQPCRQIVSSGGSWSGSVRAAPGDLSSDESRMFVQHAEWVAEALLAAGYFGPFNIDAFRYQAPRANFFNPRCEINARYTMGWAVGMGKLRPDREP